MLDVLLFLRAGGGVRRSSPDRWPASTGLRKGVRDGERFLSPMWKRATSWFDANAQHVTAEFIPDPGGSPGPAYEGYLRIWLAEGFLAKAATWGNKHFPVLHGGAALTFLGGTIPFTTFARPPGSWTIPGAQLDFPLTPLLPFNGGVVEVEAALYQASTTGPLVTALQIVGNFDALLAPPLSIAATIAGKVADGVDSVLGTDQPVLGVHWAMVAPGGGGNVLRPGSLVVITKPRDALGGSLSIETPRACAWMTATGPGSCRTRTTSCSGSSAARIVMTGGFLSSTS